jgi:hypothetical protein
LPPVNPKEQDPNERISPSYWITHADFQMAYGRPMNSSEHDRQLFFRLAANADNAKRYTTGPAAGNVIPTIKRPNEIPILNSAGTKSYGSRESASKLAEEAKKLAAGMGKTVDELLNDSPYFATRYADALYINRDIKSPFVRSTSTPKAGSTSSTGNKPPKSTPSPVSSSVSSPPSSGSAIVDTMKSQGVPIKSDSSTIAPPATVPDPTKPGRKNQTVPSFKPTPFANVNKGAIQSSSSESIDSANGPMQSIQPAPTGGNNYIPVPTYSASSASSAPQSTSYNLASSITQSSNAPGIRGTIKSNASQTASTNVQGFKVGSPLGLSWETPTEIVADTPANTKLYNWYMDVNRGRAQSNA